MKLPFLPLISSLALISQVAIAPSAKAESFPAVPGMCQFYEDNKLKVQQPCAVFSEANSQSVTLFWEDNVKTKIDTAAAAVDGLDAEKTQGDDQNCYQIQENGKRICYTASRQKPKYISHGCGTGCRVEAILITNARRNSHKLNGKFVNTASLYIRSGQFLYDEKKKEISEGGITYAYASCSSRTLGFSNQYGKAPAEMSKVPSDGIEYTTAGAGRGFFFDALCK